MTALLSRALTLFENKKLEIEGTFPGSPSTVATLVIDTGSRERLVLKQFSPDCTASEVEREHALVRALSDNGSRLARPAVRLSDGRSVVTIETDTEKHYFALYPFVPSEPQLSFLQTGLPSNIVDGAAKGLALLHGDLRKIGAVRAPLDFNPETWVVKKLESLNLEKSYCGPYVEALLPTIRAMSTFPRQMIHSDIHPGNMTFQHGEVTCIFDFKAAHFNSRMWDVAYGATYFGLTDEDRLDSDNCELFLRSYSSACKDFPITEIERKNFPEIVRTVALVNHLWVLTLPQSLRLEGSKYSRLLTVTRTILDEPPVTH